MAEPNNSPTLSVNVDEEDIRKHVMPLLKYSDSDLLKIFQRSRQQAKLSSIASRFRDSTVSIPSISSAPPSFLAKHERLSCDSSTTLATSLGSSIYSSDSSPPGPTSNPDNTYFCTDGNDYPVRATFGRKSDFIKHETKHHRTDEDWQCPVNSCPILCDRFIDLKKHYKTAHGGSLRSQNLVLPMRTLLIPQEIFACGFVGCKLWFEDWQKRCDHVTQHMLAGCNPTQWDGSTIMRNLLRQPLLHQAWKQLLSIRHGADKTKWPTLVWDLVKSPQTLRQKLTRILVLKLERRDFRPGIFHIIEYVYELGLPELATAGPDAIQHLTRMMKMPSRDSIPDGASEKVQDKILMRFAIAMQEEVAPEPEQPCWKEPSPLSLEPPPMLVGAESLSAPSVTPELNDLAMYQQESLISPISPIHMTPSFSDQMAQHPWDMVPPPAPQPQKPDIMDVDQHFQSFVMPNYAYMPYNGYDAPQQYSPHPSLQ